MPQQTLIFLTNYISLQQSRASLTICAALVKVEFLVPELPLEFGQSLKLVGGAPSLGNWEATTGATLEWQEGNNWKGEAEIEAGSEVEFKLVKVAGEDWSSWEKGENKILSIPASASGVHVVCSWEGVDISVKVSESTPAVVEEAPKKTRASSTKAKAPKKAKEEEQPKVAEPVAAAAPAPAVAPAPVVAVEEKKEAPQEPIVESTPEPEAPAHVESNSNGSGVDIPSEMSSLADKISVSSDGALVIEFGGSADGVTAASLAEKLRK